MKFAVRALWMLLVPVILCYRPGPAEAGGRLPNLGYRGGAYGWVIFDHQLHAASGFRCNDCHSDFARTGKVLFATRKQGLITFGDHRSGTKCFACHDGKGAADAVAKSPFYDGRGAFDDCEKCHYKDNQWMRVAEPRRGAAGELMTSRPE